MNILIVTPAPPRSRKGNRVTALRWRRHLLALGHRAKVLESWRGEPCDVLIALHARRSYPSIMRFHSAHPNRALFVALTGTDIYRDIRTSRCARESLDLASRLIVLQPLARQALPRALHKKVAVIYQSVVVPARTPRPRKHVFDVCVLGHLRDVKDPLRAAFAARRLPAESRIVITHVGSALTRGWEHRARREVEVNERYRWLGELPRWKALRVLARSRLLVQSSKIEGGANAVSEAIALGVPVLASRIPGSVGMLGRDYPGFYPCGNTVALVRLLRRAETHPAFYRGLKSHITRLRPMVDPAVERRRWAELLKIARP